MLQEVIQLHDEAVTALVDKIARKNVITFKSPTGSGKTHMMADFMDRILSERNDVIFLVSSLSKSELAKQNYDKFCECKEHGEFSHLSPYLISSEVSGEEGPFVPIDYNVYVLPRDLYKKGGRLMQGAMDNFLQTITSNLFGNGMNKQVYLIKDECHQATNNLDSISKDYFSKTINMSATPKLSRGQVPDVEITEEAAVNARLIKTVEWNEEDSDVAEAIEKLEEIKEDYRNRLDVNPCLIIQISNKDKANDDLARIYDVLNKPEHKDLKWMLIVNNSKECDTNDILKTKKLPVDISVFRGERHVGIFSKISIDLSNLNYDEKENKSAAMIRGVAKYLTDHGYKIGGFDGVSSSTIFPGAGVSSSAAFELLIGQIFNELFNDGKIDKITLAKAGQYSENNYYGKASGLLDQIGVAFGNAVQIDFEDINNPKVEPIEFPFNDLTFVGVNTGGDHSSMNCLYSKIPLDMKSAANKMGVNFLREASLKKLKQTKNLTDVEFNRSFHFYNENERVLKAIQAIKNKDLSLFLNQINESRISSTSDTFRLHKNTYFPIFDLLVYTFL